MTSSTGVALVGLVSPGTAAGVYRRRTDRQLAVQDVVLRDEADAGAQLAYSL